MAITKLAFSGLADLVRVKVGDAMVYGKAKAEPSKKGNVGFYANGRVGIKVGGVVKSEWASKMAPIAVKVGDTDMLATPKVFSTGSVGYNFNGKTPMELSTGELVMCQVGGNITIHKSKELDDTDLIGGLLSAQVGANITVLGSDKWETGEERQTDVERGTQEFVKAMSANTHNV